MIKVAVFASGNGSNFENLVAFARMDKYSSYKVVLLVVDQDPCGAIGRSQALILPYVYINPKAFSSKEAYEEEVLQQLKDHQVQVLALAGYMRFIGPVLLQAYPNRILNIHPSLLPNFPGKNGIGDAFCSKAKKTGVTVHVVDAGVDTGPVLKQRTLEIQEAWTLEELEMHIHKIEHALYPEVMKEFCRNLCQNTISTIPPAVGDPCMPCHEGE